MKVSPNSATLFRPSSARNRRTSWFDLAYELNARLRYFDPVRRRAGVPEDVAALLSALDDRRTVVTLVNVSETASRTVIVQAGGYAEHQFESVAWIGRTERLDARDFTVRLAPGAGATLTIAMRRYANTPTVAFPWDRR